ncbi:MAG TPA: hypothetical protein VFS36_15525 [Chitinophagaceae bacterium]|jgi:effector-binding domain-containing protein|nr:hypothetical protein [Chitinophagaceae bacterium]
MKKRILFILAGITILLIVILIVFPFRFYVKKTVHISAPVQIVSDQLSNPNNWSHWFPDLKSKQDEILAYADSGLTTNTHSQQNDSLRFTFIKITPTEIFAKEQKADKTIYHALFAIPDSFGMATNVTWAKSYSPIGWLKEIISPSREMLTGLNNLKRFSENPKYAYGFQISIKRITDTLVITKMTRTRKENSVNTLREMFDELEGYTKKYHLRVNNLRMAAFKNKGNDTVEILAGIPVIKRAPETADIVYLKMPGNGRMLVGEYEGPYQGIHKLYEAMERYKIDKTLQQVATNYEKYFTDPVTHEDSLHMKIELNYPIL